MATLAQHAVPAAPADIDTLQADGFTILRGAVNRNLIAEIEADLADRFEQTPFCEGGFYVPDPPAAPGAGGQRHVAADPVHSWEWRNDHLAG